MELGLFDEAADKLAQAMDFSEDPADRWQSAHGLGLCLLSMAKRDHHHGKAGLALQHLQRGIDACQRVDLPFACVLKVLGDLHSLGALLPPDVFSESDVDSEERTGADEESMVRRQLAFVEAGVKAYEGSEAAIRGATDGELQAMRSSVSADIGSNLLLQAQLVSLWHGKGVDEMASPETEKLLDRAEKQFRRSIDLSPEHAAAWCGLGCAVHKFDPLLAQHAFCRSIELDPMFSEPYANLSFLYTRCGILEASEQVSMALTQVADTPMMWMNRALLLERHEGPDSGSAAAPAALSHHPFEQAADAYRAALQVAPLPAAKYGLALTCRRRRRASPAMDRMLVDESHCLLGEYRDATGHLDVASRAFGGVATIEGGVVESSHTSSNLLEAGRRQVLSALERLDDTEDDRDGDLDKDIIQSIVGLRPDLSATDEAAREHTDVHADPSELQQQLYLDPTRGDLWLALAKALVRGSPEEMEDDAASFSIVRAAADRACHILDAHARDPASRRDKCQVVSAKLLSEALALRCWLDALGAPDTEEEEARSEVSTVDLQRALMLCPDNAMAREALALVGRLR
jgi:tetratricopeptide (TPR) repeat protein